MPPSRSWLSWPTRRPSVAWRLFCFPYAGGGTALFRDWPSLLPPQIELCTIAAPGREARFGEPAPRQVAEWVDGLFPELETAIDRPFALFGHSLGALVAFELARRLRERRARQPDHLFVSGCRAPQLPRSKPPTHDLPTPAFREELRRMNGTPPEVLAHPELLELLEPLLRADFAAAETYSYAEAPPLEVPILAFGGDRDPEVSQADLGAWSEQTTAAFGAFTFPGDHFFLGAAKRAVLARVRGSLENGASRPG
jgi:medium-chain acyl-[acyl-carrier-protein] hydrolase